MWKPLENALIIFLAFAFIIHTRYVILCPCFSSSSYLQIYLVMLVSSAASAPCQIKSSCCDYAMSLTKKFYLFTASINSFWPPPICKKLVWASSSALSLVSGAMHFFLSVSHESHLSLLLFACMWLCSVPQQSFHCCYKYLLYSAAM